MLHHWVTLNHHVALWSLGLCWGVWISSLKGIQLGSGACTGCGRRGSGQAVGLTAALCYDFRASAGSESSHLTLNRAVSDQIRPFDPDRRGQRKGEGEVEERWLAARMSQWTEKWGEVHFNDTLKFSTIHHWNLRWTLGYTKLCFNICRPQSSICYITKHKGLFTVIEISEVGTERPNES